METAGQDPAVNAALRGGLDATRAQAASSTG
jgi:hypothetical protein